MNGKGVGSLPQALLDVLRTDVCAASWFAALGEELTEGDRVEATAYAQALDLPTVAVGQVRDWPQAERTLKSPDWSPDWWKHEEVLRRRMLAQAETRYPERALWTVLTELTIEAGDLAHGKAATAALRAGNAAAASAHVAAGAAAQAVYQLAVARLAGGQGSLFEIKFRLFASGHWPLGVVGSTLILF